MKTSSPSTIWAGFDVGKKTFSACLDIPNEQTQYFPVNELTVKDFHRTDSGFERFWNWQKQQLEAHGMSQFTLRIVMETTGCYSRDLVKIIEASHPEAQPVMESGSIINLYKKSLGLRNETDHLDAKAIARYGTERSPIPQEPIPGHYLALREMKRTRDSLIECRTQLTNAQETLSNDFSRKANQRTVQTINRQIEMLEKEIKKLVEEYDDLRIAIGILCSFPGIAFVAAFSILAETGPLERFQSSRAFSAATGLSPMLKQSGSSVNKAKISRQGFPGLRKSLYLISIIAVKQVPALNRFYNELLGRGKTPMKARVACMRKMATILRAMVVNRNYFEEIFEKKIKKD